MEDSATNALSEMSNLECLTLSAQFLSLHVDEINASEQQLIGGVANLDLVGRVPLAWQSPLSALSPALGGQETTLGFFPSSNVPLVFARNPEEAQQPFLTGSPTIPRPNGPDDVLDCSPLRACLPDSGRPSPPMTATPHPTLQPRRDRSILDGFDDLSLGQSLPATQALSGSTEHRFAHTSALSSLKDEFGPSF